jgi:hypothetical protein
MEDTDISTGAPTAPTRTLVTEDNAKTDMAHFAQLLRRSLSITESEPGAARQTKISKTLPVATERIVRIPTPSPRPSFVLVSSPTKTNAETRDVSATVSGPQLTPSAAFISCSRGDSVSNQNRDGSKDRPRQRQAIDLAHLMETKEEHLKSLKTHLKSLKYQAKSLNEHAKSLEEQIIGAESDISSIKTMVQTLLNQGQLIPSTAVVN